MAQQGELLAVCALCGGRMWHGQGQLRATVCPDGRVLLRLEDGRKDGKWLELLPADVVWLMEILARSCRTTTGA